MEDLVDVPELRVDEQANAAFWRFAEGPVAKTLPVCEGDRVVATLSFLEAGELQGLELLDARTQLPGVRG